MLDRDWLALFSPGGHRGQGFSSFEQRGNFRLIQLPGDPVQQVPCPHTAYIVGDSAPRVCAS